MFKSAKIKLTAWYLAILMLVTFSVSTLVYFGVVRITERALESQRRRLERQLIDFGPYKKPMPFFPNIDTQAFEDIKSRTLWTLIGINALILVSAGSLGYFLAHKTLMPIEVMLERQKRFISDAAHELKTPITSLKTGLEVALRDKNISLEDAKAVIESSIVDTDNLHQLTQKLLNQSKYKSKQQVYKTVDFESIVSKAIDTVKRLAVKNNIEIVSSLMPIKIRCDADAILEAVINVIENAIKYSEPNNKVEIKLYMDKNYAVLQIKDYGIGILKNDLPHIFDPFYRGDKSRTNSQHNGHGLGLTITKEIIDQHKGSINIKSTAQKGTSVVIRLPALSNLSE